MRFFAKLIFVSGTPRGQLKYSIAVRAERVCTHTSARKRLNTHEIDKDKPMYTVDKFSFQ